jgi:hypothetical protein
MDFGTGELTAPANRYNARTMGTHDRKRQQ